MRRVLLAMALVWLCWARVYARSEENPVSCRALLVGCDAFLLHENTAPSAALNVERIARMLQTDARVYERVTRLDGGVSSVSCLAEAVTAAFEGADENDISLIYICTHGLYDRVASEPFLVLSDGVTEENLSAAQLRDLLDPLPGQKLLLLDACNSGAFIGKGVWDERLGNSFCAANYHVLTSAGASESSFLWRGMRMLGGGSYFAEELSEGVRAHRYDLNADGVITLGETYAGLLENYGASMAQLYPQGDDFPLYVYNVGTNDSSEGAISELLLDTAVLGEGEDTLYFSFTVRRPVRVQYQIIYYNDGVWRFDAPQIIEDMENSAGALTPGRKERAVTLVNEDDAPYGYVLLQLITQEGRYARLAGTRLIAVQPGLGNPRLALWTAPDFAPQTGEELTIYVRHDFPCSLTVTVRDSAGSLVRRLGYKVASRPLGTAQEGSFFYWDGKDNTGEDVPCGAYSIVVSSKIGGEVYECQSGWIYVQ